VVKGGECSAYSVTKNCSILLTFYRGPRQSSSPSPEQNLDERHKNMGEITELNEITVVLVTELGPCDRRK